MTRQTSVRLSPLAFDVCFEWVGAVDRPYPLDVPHHGDTMEERARLRAVVFRDLEARGLARDGRLGPEFVEALRILARPHAAIEALILPDPTRPPGIAVLAAAAERSAVLAALDTGGVSFEQISVARLADAVAALVPTGPIVRPSSYRLPLHTLQCGGMRTDTILDAPTDDRQRYRAEIRAVTEILGRPRTAVAQFSATGVDRLGHRRRSATLDWFATADGAFLSRLNPGRGDEQWLTLTTADRDNLSRHLGELLTSLR